MAGRWRGQGRAGHTHFRGQTGNWTLREQVAQARLQPHSGPGRDTAHRKQGSLATCPPWAAEVWDIPLQGTPGIPVAGWRQMLGCQRQVIITAEDSLPRWGGRMAREGARQEVPHLLGLPPTSREPVLPSQGPRDTEGAEGAKPASSKGRETWIPVLPPPWHCVPGQGWGGACWNECCRVPGGCDTPTGLRGSGGGDGDVSERC